MSGGWSATFNSPPRATATLENTPVLVLEGQWKPQQLALLLPQHKDKLAAGRQVNLALLPPQLPAHVRLVLRREDHFPVRIDYLRVGEAAEPDAPPPLEPIMTMELYDVRLGKEIDPFVFDYKPGNLEVADHTEVYLGSLGLRIAPRPTPRPSLSRSSDDSALGFRRGAGRFKRRSA